MATSLVTSTYSSAFGYATNNKVSVLWDGSLVLVDFDGTNGHVYQVTNPSGTPTTTSVATMGISGSGSDVLDVFVLDNGNSSNDVWVVYGSNLSAAGIGIAHATYSSTGIWTWDNTATTISSESYAVDSVVWTGSYLVVAYRTSPSANVYGAYIQWTSTKNGSTGWSARQQLSGSTASSSHYFPSLQYDSVLKCIIAIYSTATDNIVARVFDATNTATTPDIANWGSEVTVVGGNSISIGAANVATFYDQNNSRLHIAWSDSKSGTTKSPGYCNSSSITISGTSSTIAFHTPLGIGTASTLDTSPSMTMDSNGLLYLFWATSASGTSSDVEYVTLASPYTSTSATINQTNAAARNNTFPHVPSRQPCTQGYIPLIYQAGTANPYTLYLDNSITFIVQNSLGDIATGTDSVSVGGTGLVPISVSDSAVGTDAPSFPGVVALSAGDTTVGTDSELVTGAGTNPAGLSTSTRTQTWYAGGSGTETDISYIDYLNTGWRVGAIPSYGGAIICAWYEVNNGIEVNSNQQSLYTSTSGTVNPDGWTHMLADATSAVYAGSTYDGSETYPYTTLGLQEQSPVGTDFRRYYKADVNNGTAVGSGLIWHVWSCIYPGDPGLIVDRVDVTNPSASPVTLHSGDSLSLDLLAGLNSGTGTGAWNTANGGYGTVGGTITTPLPTAVTGGEPDYYWLTPQAGSGQSIGIGSVKGTKLSSGGVGWTGMTFQAVQDTIRLKVINFGSYPTFPALTTQSYYVLRVLKRNLTPSYMTAIAADFLNPGTPTVTTGSYTAWRIDERAYEFAAINGQVSGQLDLSPTNVTVRYRPILKVTNWTTPAGPMMFWGGSPLVANSDYRWVVDTTNNILYVQCWFDVISSGATIGQMNNAAFTLEVVQDIAAGSDAVAVVISQSLPDTGTGAEGLSFATITPVVPDTSAGNDVTTLGTIAISPPDSATGADIPTIVVTELIPDSSTGQDGAPTLPTISLAPNDIGSGGESIGATATFSQNDTASGNENLSAAQVFSLTDNASGLDSITLPTLDTSIGDSALGTDYVSLIPSPPITDSGAGSDTAFIPVDLTVPVDTSHGTDFIPSVGSSSAVIAVPTLMGITDNIARTLLDLESAYIGNQSSIIASILTGQGAPANSLTSRVFSLGQIGQEVDLASATLNAANNVIGALNISYPSLYVLYRSLLVALEKNTGGLSNYLIGSMVQVHPEFANAFNYIAANAGAFGYNPITLILPSSIFIPNSISLAQFQALSATTGTNTLLGSIDLTLYAAAPLFITTTLGAGSRIGNISLVINYINQYGKASTANFTQTPASGKLALGVTGSAITNLILTAGGVSGDTYLITGEPLRIPTY